MSAALQQLQSLIGEPLNSDGIGSTWELSRKLADKEDVFFHPLVTDHAILSMHYNVLCSRLVHDLTDKGKDSGLQYSEEKEAALTKQLIDALALAELLTHIYCHYLYIPSEVTRLKQEQRYYRRLLSFCGYRFPKNLQKAEVSSDSSFAKNLRQHHRDFNWPRLFIVRIRRVLVTLTPILANVKYGGMIDCIDLFIGPALNHLSWIYFIPRLATNVFLLLKHLIPGQWMSQEEMKLGWLIRLQAQMQRRWFEMFNDAAWMTGGLLNCFILVGALAPVGMYVTLSLFFFDVVMASVRAYIELGRINDLLIEDQKITNAMSSSDVTPEKLAEIGSYRYHLEQRFYSERRRLLLSVFSTSALFLAMCFAIPALAGNPIIPLVGAILVVTITLATYLLGKWWVEPQNPEDKMDAPMVEGGLKYFAQSRYVLFQTRPSLNSGESQIQPNNQVSDHLNDLHPSRSMPHFDLTFDARGGVF